jgi:hypothetical protein
MGKVKQSKAELLAHLSDCEEFLGASSEAFDRGQTGEAKRLAVTVRVLLHDTKGSKSLLGQLGWKSGHDFLDSAIGYDSKNLLPQHGLVALRIGGGGGSYDAPLGNGSPSRPYKYVRFPNWWNQTVIFDSRQHAFNRRDLVLVLSNKDGGAHVDPTLDQAYVELSRNNSVGWTIQDGSGRRPMIEVERHSMRQIAYEVSRALEKLRRKHGA